MPQSTNIPKKRATRSKDGIPVPKGTRLMQPNGSCLVVGAGGGPQPGSGRPPDAFRALCRELACSGTVAAAVVLQDANHPAYLGALKWATEHGYGKPKETIDVTVSLSPEERERAVVGLLAEAKRRKEGK